MSKRASVGGNTLFNYFTKKSNSNGKISNNEDNLKNITTEEKFEKRPFNDSDEEEITQPVKRRKQVICESDEEENRANNIPIDKTPRKSSNFKVKENSQPSSSENDESNSQSIRTDTWLHNTLQFLKPDYIKDKNGRRPSQPDYDSKTLFVPNNFLEKQTPAMCQWWVMKIDYFDCILFFKVGKFYELYHMDAVIGVNELGFSYMKGEFAHSGFPESAYGRMVNSLVDLGYKVARVEQTETPDAMSERLRDTPRSVKQPKVVRREICQVTNKATRVHGLQDSEVKQSLSLYLLAIMENQTQHGTEFGVCFVDTTLGTFHIGQFQDDSRCSRLHTMLIQNPPAVILEERKQLSSNTKHVLKIAAGSADIESLSSESQFYTSTKTLKLLCERDYFRNKDSGKVVLPSTLQDMTDEDDCLNSTCKKDYDVAVRCLGACLWYLEYSLLDIQLFTIGKFELYLPSDLNNVVTSKYMVLDSSAISSLNIFGSNRSMETMLDFCSTAFGKRLLRQWISRPLYNINEIKKRQEAISELIENSDLLEKSRQILANLPDLERLVTKIHWMGNSLRAKNHPDSRAIFYEEKTYSKKKIQDFVNVLNGFEKALSLCDIFSTTKSEILRKHICLDDNSLFPNVEDTIKYFQNFFDFEEALKVGKIIPQEGLDAEYDATIDRIDIIKQKLNKYLESQEKYFGCKLSYFGSDKKRFQLDIPDNVTRKITSEYSLESTKKGSKPTKRYTTSETKNLLAQMMAAESKNTEVLQDLNRRIFEKFTEKFEDWHQICYCLSVIDVLLSLAEYTRNQNSDMCIPEILSNEESAMISIKNGIHPYTVNVESFVPNDTELGTENHSPVLILTGPNMGGKSTLMQQVALITIMAQLGCHVPASEMKFTLVDRIFTRLGAQDDIMAGNSTFLVELVDASAILQHATKSSLVFLDELGRGTSTYDGAAIAIAYVGRLIAVNCRSMFSTHYYNLLDYYKNNVAIQLGHMACKVESDEDNVTQESVIFMYKMISGPCPKSYGFNAARLAGISNIITKRAHDISKTMETDVFVRKIFRNIFSESGNVNIINSVLD